MTSPASDATGRSIDRTTVTWAATVGLTVVSAALVVVLEDGRGSPSAALSFVVLAIGAVKARLILREFMEIRSAPRWLQVTTDVWLVATVAIIVAFYSQ